MTRKLNKYPCHALDFVGAMRPAKTNAQTKAEGAKEREKMINEAVAYCHENDCRGDRALSRNPNRWPGLHRSSINRALDGRKGHAVKQILTEIERTDLAETLHQGADAGFAYRAKDRNSAVMDILEWRQICNKKGGRKFVKLTPAALKAMRRGKCSKHFWRKFYADFPGLELKLEVVAHVSCHVCT